MYLFHASGYVTCGGEEEASESVGAFESRKNFLEVGFSAVGTPEANMRILWTGHFERNGRVGVNTHRKVKMGDTTDPYWADRAEFGKAPLVVGDRQRAHIPHQQSILVEIPSDNGCKILEICTYSPK